jgi:hypothetical protein
MSDYVSKTHEICLEAVKQHGGTLQFVKEKTDKICNAAILD